MKLSMEAEVGRPIEEVFAFLAHHENHASIFVENVSCKQVTPGPMAVGTRVENTARVMGKTMIERFEITDFEPPRVIGKASQEGSTFETTDRFDLEPIADDKTRVRVTVTGSPAGLGQRMMLVVIEPVMKRSLKKALGRLKQLMEGGA